MTETKYRNVPPVGTWVRHNKTGDLAQIIEKDGEMWIKPDLPGSPVLYPATQIYNWNIEPGARKMPPGSWARVCYVADQALCDIHPDFKRVPTDWLSLHPNEKARWIEAKIKFKEVLRLELYNAIMSTLEKHTK